MKTLQGTITSMKTPKTVRVTVARQWQHPLYGKFVKRTKNYACHYENIDLQMGDTVIIEECRPISKTKKFKVVEKVTK